VVALKVRVIVMREDRDTEIEAILKMLSDLNPHLWLLIHAAAKNQDRDIVKTVLTMWEELDTIFESVCSLKNDKGARHR